MTPSVRPRTLPPLPFEAEKERTRLRTLLDLDLAAQEGRLAAAPLTRRAAARSRCSCSPRAGNPGRSRASPAT